ncbi:MAG: c-type cytochrome [Chitinophagaceae bacterium]|nr:c-type cytochrome [Chitinophagaceae bacterium]MCW5929699.1 c-type cytochrome [Chitinophagaceae bacterium]
MKPFTLILAMAAAIISCTSGEKKSVVDWTIADNRTPGEELSGFKVPEGFVVELIASEEDGVINPIDITFDDAGRLWTQTAVMYPLDPIADIQWNDLLELMNDAEKQKAHPNFRRALDLYKGVTRGEDKILVLSDFYDYKRPGATAAVWADGLTIPMSILPYKNGAYVAQGSELFFLKDADGDGKADQRDSLFTGFGFTDTHTMTHSLVKGPGGWIYFSHGALNKGEVTSYTNGDLRLRMDYSKIARFSGDGKKMEIVTAGLNNIWGFQLRDNGQWYITEANDLGFCVVPMEPGSALKGIGNKKFKPYQPFLPELFDFRVGGTGISGLAFADDLSGSFPAEWKDVAFLANPITSTINAVKVKRNPDGTVSGEHLADFLSSKDKYFRPVNMEFGPDGSLYIADWYNKIISHNEVPTSHPERDKTRGRIWRIRHQSQKQPDITDYYKLPAKDLAEHIKSPSLWARRSALNQILERPAEETRELIPALKAIAGDGSLAEPVRIHALWALEGLGQYDAGLIKTILDARGADDLKRETIRSLVNTGLASGELAALLEPLTEDANAMVRSQALRTLLEAGNSDTSTIAVLVKACKPELPGNRMGGAFERKFERYLALHALEKKPEALLAYLQANPVPAENLRWAAMALPKGQKETWFLKAWEQSPPTDLKETEFIMVTGMLNNPRVLAAVKPVIQDTTFAKQYLTTAVQNVEAMQAPQLPSLLQPGAIALLQSGDESGIKLALDAAARLKIKLPSGPVVALINEASADETISLALRALEVYARENKPVFAQAAQNEKINFNLRTIALRALVNLDQAEAARITKSLLPVANEEQKRNLSSTLSGSVRGAALLKEMYAQQLIGAESFSISAAERVKNADPVDKLGAAILAAVQKKREEDERAFKDKLEKYIAIAEKKEGDPGKGSAIFQNSCLLCHKVGDKGQDIAPALDGSANRDNEALLTAILNPDAAVEGGYEIFRVVKRDNSTIEGYLYNRADNGITIAIMGGNKIFVPDTDIKSTQVLGGRSFMPKGLIDQYTDEQVADLLAYIRTLK